jgi:hypothetical protein
MSEEIFEIELDVNKYNEEFSQLDENDKNKVIELGLLMFKLCDERKQVWDNEDWNNKIDEFKLELETINEKLKLEKKKSTDIIDNMDNKMNILHNEITKNTELVFKNEIEQWKMKYTNLKKEMTEMNNNMIQTISNARENEKEFWTKRCDNLRKEYDTKLENEKKTTEKFMLMENNSQKKGVYGEEFGIHLCNQLFPCCEIEDTHATPHRGDIIIHDEEQNILLDIKNYKSNIPKKEIDKFYFDMEYNDDVHAGMLISLKTGIIAKKNFSIEIIKGKPIIFLYKVLDDPDCITHAMTLLKVILNNDIRDFSNVEILQKLKSFSPSLKRIYKKMKGYLKKHEENMVKCLVDQETIQKEIYSLLNVKY